MNTGTDLVFRRTDPSYERGISQKRRRKPAMVGKPIFARTAASLISSCSSFAFGPEALAIPHVEMNESAHSESNIIIIPRVIGKPEALEMGLNICKDSWTEPFCLRSTKGQRLSGTTV